MGRRLSVERRQICVKGQWGGVYGRRRGTKGRQCAIKGDEKAINNNVKTLKVDNKGHKERWGGIKV